LKRAQGKLIGEMDFEERLTTHPGKQLFKFEKSSGKLIVYMDFEELMKDCNPSR
jgi:hypothetical protein